MSWSECDLIAKDDIGSPRGNRTWCPTELGGDGWFFGLMVCPEFELRDLILVKLRVERNPSFAPVPISQA
ncbi:MAG: hypothetical protein IT349_19910 [Candidatus Eisenbacteria bacterium]|nr:hypothetical protein [Candidatus Eisenbacteria bacterium]MCC7144369.1 hypothetical protein [Candidatus Eisenbacteria bacterium]